MTSHSQGAMFKARELVRPVQAPNLCGWYWEHFTRSDLTRTDFLRPLLLTRTWCWDVKVGLVPKDLACDGKD